MSGRSTETGGESVFSIIHSRVEEAVSKPQSLRKWSGKLAAAVVAGAMAAVGCQSSYLQDAVDEASLSDVPRELQMASIPVYRVAPPDILSIELVRNIRPANSGLKPGDFLLVRASNLEPFDERDEEIEKAMKTVNAEYLVQSDGTIDLGPWYGSVSVAGLTPTQAEREIQIYLQSEHTGNDGRVYGGYIKALVSASLPNVGAEQIVSGEHLIRPDGMVSLGIYGSVYVAGMTLEEVKAAVEEHLRDEINDAEVSVDVLSYNSKVIYLITDGGGAGVQVVKIPFTGNETVLDALASINGTSPVSSNKMWVARPAPNGVETAQVMPVDWRAITQDAVTTTNYQLMPGDRIYIKADGLIAADNFIAKVTQPVTRLFGFTLLGNGVVRSLQTNTQGGGTGGGGVF